MPERRLIVLLALTGTASADTCPTPPLRTHDGDTVTVLGCVAGHFPASGVAVLAQVTPKDLSDDPSDDAPHVAISLVLVNGKGKLLAAAEPEPVGAWALEVTRFGALSAVDLDGDGSDEVIVPDDTNVDGATSESLFVYGRIGKRVQRLGIVETAKDDTALYGDTDPATVCTSTTRIEKHRLIIDGKVTAGPSAASANAIDCISGHREYRVAKGKLTY